MDVETLVLHQRKIKARHKGPWSFILVLLFAAASVSMSASVAGDDETANEMKRLMSGRSPRSANPTMYDDSVVSDFIHTIIYYTYILEINNLSLYLYYKWHDL